MPLRTLIAEPDRLVAEGWREALEAEGHRVTLAQSGTEFETASRSTWDLAVIDVRVLGQEEASLLHFLRARSPRAGVVLTAAPQDAEAALRAGMQTPSSLLLKPIRPADLVIVLKRLALAEAPVPASTPPEGEEAPFAYHGVVGKSLAMRRVLRLAAKVAPTDSSVVITGETGVGKELVARMIQRLSPRADRPFVTVNCGAIPDNLVESELFGHKAGSFTDAVADKKGLFEIAHGGTMLLDEVGELPLAAQVKLLRALEDHEIRRVGDTAPIRADVRVLAATNRDLAEDVRQGRFREDLWFRLNVVQIHLPALRDRPEDVPPLLLHFLADANRRFGKNTAGFSPEALSVIGRYDFPGNIRELRNLVEHAVVMADHQLVRIEDLPLQVVTGASRDRLLTGPAGRPAPAVAPGPEPGGEFKTIARAEQDLIAWTLRKLGGNQTEVAKRLGISRSTLWRKIKEYGITV
ncbi:MAG: sigma-54 dependent transcriptional regulator [Candidatus Coatesbacteria bacterium]